jgi:hypothetical protein
MKTITEFKTSEKKLTFDEAVTNTPEGYRLPTKKELMLMYVMAEEENLTLPKSNTWSSDEFFLKNGESTSAFAVQFGNGYTATIKKNIKNTAMYVKK